jgi:hypothetical protein
MQFPATKEDMAAISRLKTTLDRSNTALVLLTHSTATCIHAIRQGRLPSGTQHPPNLQRLLAGARQPA